jgi:hypothetical protein
MATLHETLQGVDALLEHHRTTEFKSQKADGATDEMAQIGGRAYATGRVTTALALLLDEKGRESFIKLVRESGALDAQAERDAQAEADEWGVN